MINHSFKLRENKIISRKSQEKTNYISHMHLCTLLSVNGTKYLRKEQSCNNHFLWEFYTSQLLTVEKRGQPQKPFCHWKFGGRHLHVMEHTLITTNSVSFFLPGINFQPTFSALTIILLSSLYTSNFRNFLRCTCLTNIA